MVAGVRNSSLAERAGSNAKGFRPQYTLHIHIFRNRNCLLRGGGDGGNIRRRHGRNSGVFLDHEDGDEPGTMVYHIRSNVTRNSKIGNRNVLSVITQRKGEGIRGIGITGSWVWDYEFLRRCWEFIGAESVIYGLRIRRLYKFTALGLLSLHNSPVKNQQTS